MDKYRDIIGRINYGLFLAMVFLLPFPQIALRYVGTAWVISWFLELRWLQISDLRSLLTKKTALPFLLFGAWFIWKLISGLWAPDIAAWSWKIERYLAFLFLVPIGIWGTNEHYNWRQAGQVWGIGCLAAIPAYLIWMTLLFLHPEIVPYLNVPSDWIQHPEWLTFFSENLSHFKHRLFLNSVELFGIVLAVRVWKEKKGLLAVIIPVIAAFILLTDSRQTLITAAVMAGVGLAGYVPKRYRWSYWLGVIALVGVLGFAILKLHPRMQDFGLNGLSNMRELSYYHDVRLNIWGAALQQPGDYIAYGLGAGQSTDYIARRFQEVGFEGYVQEQYNAHNQYLEELLELGLGGLILFVLAWLSIPLCAKKEERTLAVQFTLLFMLNMCTECMFGRFCGIILWAVGMGFVLIANSLSSPSRAA